MTSKKWIASESLGGTPGVWREGDDEQYVAVCHSHADSHQIAHEHNTHAALVEALEAVKADLGWPELDDAAAKVMAALAAAKGGPK